MKIFTIMILCVLSLSSTVQGVDTEQLNLLNNITSGIAETDIQGGCDKCGDLCIQLSVPNHNVLAKAPKKALAVQAVKIHANSVSITVLNGYTFHVADYYGPYGNSRIVTCLDGDMQGHQGIADNGILRIESTNFEWYKDYFVHYYPAGKVVSYANKQTAEFY
jgi:hypothetical protein